MLAEATLAPIPGRETADDHRRAVDGGGQDQPAVVVGVIAQELDPTGGPAQGGRLAVEGPGERGPGDVFRRRGHGRPPGR